MYLLWFGCGSHKIFVVKLYYDGIHRVNAYWIESYLVNKKKKVKIILQYQQQKIFQKGNIKVYFSPGINSRTFIVHNAY